MGKHLWLGLKWEILSDSLLVGDVVGLVDGCGSVGLTEGASVVGNGVVGLVGDSVRNVGVLVGFGVWREVGLNVGLAVGNTGTFVGAGGMTGFLVGLCVNGNTGLFVGKAGLFVGFLEVGDFLLGF